MVTQNSNILYVKENGIEYFTAIETGESGISESGLSRMSGIPQKTLNRWLQNLRKPSQTGYPEWLEPLKNMLLELSQEVFIPRKTGAVKVTPIRSDFAASFIGLVAKNLKTDESIKTLTAIAIIGLTSYIQGKTKWLPKDKQASQEARSTVDEVIQSLPRRWELHFDRNWQQESCRLTSYRWSNDIRMASFISKAIYKLLPDDVYKRLMEVNGDRKKKHHQFFTEKADELVLKQHIQRVYGLMLASNSTTQFWRLMGNAFGGGIQMDMDI